MTSPPPRIMRISRAEKRVLDELLADGAGNARLASRLNLGVETVKRHMSQLISKAGVDNRTALVVAIVRKRVQVLHPPDKRERQV